MTLHNLAWLHASLTWSGNSFHRVCADALKDWLPYTLSWGVIYESEWMYTVTETMACCWVITLNHWNSVSGPLESAMRQFTAIFSTVFDSGTHSPSVYNKIHISMICIYFVTGSNKGHSLTDTVARYLVTSINGFVYMVMTYTFPWARTDQVCNFWRNLEPNYWKLAVSAHPGN